MYINQGETILLKKCKLSIQVTAYFYFENALGIRMLYKILNKIYLNTLGHFSCNVDGISVEHLKIKSNMSLEHCTELISQ